MPWAFFAWSGACPAVDSASCAHFAGVAGTAETGGIAGAALRPEDVAAGRVVFAGHDDRSCVHDFPSPSVSMSNVASLVLPSASRVPSPICRLEAVSIACMASGATISLHTSNLPTRAGYLPKATDLSDPAVNIIVLRPPSPWSDSRTNISRARSLFSQNSRHSIVRNEAPSLCFAAAILRTYGRDAASSVHAVSGKGRVS